MKINGQNAFDLVQSQSVQPWGLIKMYYYPLNTVLFKLFCGITEYYLIE